MAKDQKLDVKDCPKISMSKNSSMVDQMRNMWDYKQQEEKELNYEINKIHFYKQYENDSSTTRSRRMRSGEAYQNNVSHNISRISEANSANNSISFSQ